MNAPSNWPRNRLLLALPSRNLKRLKSELEQIRCQRAQVLVDADSALNHVFFSDSGVVSVVAVYADGSIIEMATIGREGCSGVQAILGAKRSSVQLLVQIPGSAAKMSRAAFTQAMQSMPSFRSVMDAYVQAFLEQVMVSVACNGAHSLKQRLARWLLMMRDRSDGDVLPITQSLLAEMLGVQRPSISNAAREFERAGLIERGRRQVTILDRQGLAEASCECYQLVRARLAFHKSGEGKAALERVSHRIAALGRLYSMLGETNSVEQVDAASYLEALCRDLIESVQKENGTSIALTTDIESEPLPVDRAIPLGLIVNELVTNAVKYAFPSETRGTVAVTLKRTPGELRLTVSDDGKGVDRRRSDSGLGGRLVDTFARQLGGQVARESGNTGTIVCLTLPSREAS
jgi:two-component sensor histidine kinase/CRP-like cAMP-binding protein